MKPFFQGESWNPIRKGRNSDLTNRKNINSNLLGKPFNKPFEVQVYNAKEETIKNLKLNQNDILNSEIENFSPNSSYCNGNNHLYISGGENERNVILGHLWDIDLENETIEKNIKGIEPKKNHSMIFIPDKYVFIVRRDANKVQIKDAVSKLFNVKVVGCTTMNIAGKRTRHKGIPGVTSSYKKAIVRLAPGQTIQAFEGV